MIQILRVLIFSALFLLTSAVSAQVLVPQSGNNQINCGSNTSLCDHAGCTSDYGTNADGYTIIETIGATSATLNGNYTLAAGESIIIYDGAGTGGSVITTLINSGTYNLAGTPGQQITVRFISDGALQAAGFSFTITYTGSPTIVCQSDIITGCDMIATFSDPIAIDACIPPICASEDLATVMANFTTNGAAITGAIPNGFNFSDGITGTNIPDGGSDMYDGGNQLNTNISTLLPYSNGFISANPAFGAGGQYFTQKINNMFIMVADMNNVTDFIITGNNGADGNGILNDFTYTVTSGCLDYDVFVKRINSAGDPSINQIFIVPTGTGATHTYGATTDNSLHTLSGINTADRLYYLLVAGAGGYAYTNAEIQALVLDFLTQTGASGTGNAPVTVTQIAGLPSGSVFPAGTNVVTFEATSALGATATCSFNVISPVLGVPIITCPSDVIAACDMTSTFAPPSASDPCGNGGCASEDLATVMANFIANGNAITGAIPTGFNFSDGITGTNIPDGGSDMYDGGNYLNTNISTLLPYSNGVILPHPAFGAGGQYFTQKINNMFIMVADMNNVTDFIITGNNGADGSGILNDFTYTVTSGCLDYDVFVKRINSATDPSINQIFIVPTGTGATHTYGASTDNSLHTLSGLNTADRLYYLLVAGNGGYAYTNPEIEALVLDFLTQTGASGTGNAPVTVTQIAGLPSGSVFPAGTNVVTFEAETSLGVTATCSFNVISAVPGDPVIICPSDVTTACNMIGTFTAPITADPCGTGGCASEDLATVMANFIANGAAITGAIPSPFNFTDGIFGTNIIDGGSDMYDSGNYLNTNISTLLPYSNGVILPHPAFGAGGQYFTQKINNMFIMVADMNNVTDFTITGNNGADGSGILNDFTYTVTSGCMDYDVFVKRINSAGDPSINQIFIVPTGTGATHTYGASTDNSLHTLSGLNTADRLYYLLVAGNGGYAYTNPEIEALVLDFLTQTGATVPGPGPVTVTQIAGLPSGSVFPAGSNVVTFEAETLLGVTSTCSFNVITPASTAPTITAMPGSYCPNTTITLSAGAGIAGAGSSINWYTGPNGTGTFLGAGNSINYTTSVSTNIYARREGICNNTIDDLLPLEIKSFIYALNGTSSNTYCTDNSGWHHFFNGDEIILSCQGDFSGATAGFPVVTIGDNGTFYQQTEGPGTAPGCGMGSDPGEERFEMNRNWNLDFGGGVLNPPYNVRFYYSPAERAAIETAAVNWMATYPACGYTYKYANPLGFYWFKNVGSNYAAPDYDGLQLTGINGSTGSGINYGELTAITSFSGGSGAVILSPLTLLPVTLGSFNAVCGENNDNNTIHWSTISENNSAYFTIERSRDSYNWLPVGQVPAAGSSSSVHYYSLTDKDLLSSDLLYYRLRQYDLDGASEGHGTIALECNEGALGFNINPNPASSTVAISVHGAIDKESTYFTFTDLNGRLIKHIDFTEGNGKLINVNIEQLPSGYYIIRMFRDGQSIQMERMVKL